MNGRLLARIAVIAWFIIVQAPAFAAFHLWQINEVYSNASGTVQYVQLTSAFGGQQFLAGHGIVASRSGQPSHTFMFNTNLPGDTANKKFLIATQSFAALNIVQPDYVVPDNFLYAAGGSINFADADLFDYAALPTDGVNALRRDGSVAANRPTNFNGVSGSIPAVSPTATLTMNAAPAAPVAGRAVTLNALVTGAAAGDVAFREGGATLAGCAAVAVAVLPGATDAGVATCNIAAIAAGNHAYTAAYSNAASGANAESTLSVAAAANGPLDYTDMWWQGEAENGWGVSITQHGNIQFIVFFVYDDSGKPVWYVLPNGSWNGDFTAYTGNLYQPTSSPFFAYDTTRFAAGAPVGTATFTYTSTSTANVAYTIKGVSGSKVIQRQIFGAADGAPRLRVNDLWWAGTAENGWGMNIAQQNRTLFALWYTYDANGNDTWFAFPGGTWNGRAYTGGLYATTSSRWLGAPYNPASFVVTQVGNMTLTFVDQSNATMTYTVNGVTQTKNIVRQPF